jgi:hypothetical protein
MGYLIGTDEAGYGPNLGPLVISATAWEAPDGVGGEDLFDRLSHVITPKPERGKPEKGDWPRVAMADSKALYTSGNGLRHLERGLWAALGLLDHCPRTWRGVWHAVAPEALDPMQAIPWYAGYDGPAPIDCDAAEFETLVETLRAGLAAAGVRLAAVQSRAIFAEEFNELVDRYGSKGEALSQQTLALAARMIQSFPISDCRRRLPSPIVSDLAAPSATGVASYTPGPISVICDKHGGRNRYGALLAQHFPEWLIEVRGEGRQRSSYRFGPPDRRVEFCFRTKAEVCLPAALASMASKYLRELSMRAFNDFWRRRVFELQPTAGYPQDAKRFRADIAETQRQLHIPDRVLWRMK